MPQSERPEFQAQPPGALRYRGMASSQWSITQNANLSPPRSGLGIPHTPRPLALGGRSESRRLREGSLSLIVAPCRCV